MRRFLLAAAGVAASVLASTAQAAPPSGLCPAARAALAKDAALAGAFEAAFGRPPVAPAGRDSCLWPEKLLTFPTAQVLITLGGQPGEACHACGASLTASILRRDGGRLVLVKRLEDFGQTGSFGAPGKISPVRFAGDDGLLIAHGGIWQGYAIEVASLFVFRGGRVVGLKSEGNIGLEYDNTGAAPEGSKVVSINGRWSVSGDELRVAYTVLRGGRESRAQATWKASGDRLRLVSGEQPRELKEGL